MKNIKLYADKNNKNNMELFFKYIGYTILFLGMISICFDVLLGWSYILGGFIYFAFYFIEFSDVRYVLNDKRIRTNCILGNCIRLNKIKMVKVFAEDVIFISKEKVFRIETHQIDEESLNILEGFVLDLGVEIDILPSQNTIN